MSGTRPPSRTTASRMTRRAPRKRRAGKRRSWRLGWRGWLVFGSCVVLFCLFAWAAVTRELAPSSNTSLTHFDTIIVLGSPATTDGDPSPLQLARVTEAVQEYERGVASTLILTGGPDADRPIEAQVMARIAQAQGIPRSAIFLEENARDTIQNACFSVRIMKNHGWQSAEVISNAGHLQRAGLIFSDLPIQWRTHAAPPLQPVSMLRDPKWAALETLKTLRYLLWAKRAEDCVP